jgi:hypothetical protein
MVNISFDRVEKLLDQATSHLGDLKKTAATYTQNLNSFLVSLQNYVFVEEIPEEEPEPVQAIVEPVAAVTVGDTPVKRSSFAPGDTLPAANAKGRSPSINYGLKDLANLRRRSSLDTTTSESSATSSSSSATTSITDAATVSTTLSTSKKSSPSSSSVSSDLPPNWKEMVDPKSNRMYYVNK